LAFFILGGGKYMRPILQDSGWKKVSDNRSKGITDYKREMSFISDLDDTEIGCLSSELNQKQPGNFPVTIRKVDFGKYEIYTVYDSSD
jgi:hypothetical protein